MTEPLSSRTEYCYKISKADFIAMSRLMVVCNTLSVTSIALFACGALPAWVCMRFECFIALVKFGIELRYDVFSKDLLAHHAP